MKSSYKVALGLAIALSAFVFYYYLTQPNDRDEAPMLSSSAPPREARAEPPRPTRDSTVESASADVQGSPSVDRNQAPPTRLSEGPPPPTRTAQRPARESDRDASTPARPPTTTPSAPAVTPSDAVPADARTDDSGQPDAGVPTLTLDGSTPDRTTVSADDATVPDSAGETTPTRASEARSREPAPQPATYTVQPGDTLASIATKLYDEERRWVDIAQANPLVDPLRLKVGQVLRLPGSSPRSDSSAPGEPAPRAPGPVVSHTIQAGETLSDIAKQYYNDPTQWRVIFNANRDKLGDNPNRIKSGIRIRIPPTPIAAE